MSQGGRSEQGDPAGSSEAATSMHIHKPKAVHGLREFASEIAVVVLGIVIALLGEQAVDAFHWAHKVGAAEKAIKEELAVDLSYAAEQQAMGPCAVRYIDTLEQAIAKNRPDTIMALYRMGPPLHDHPWRSDTWTAALNGQVPDHLPPERVGDYSLAFRMVTSLHDEQWELFDLYAEAMSGRFGRLDSPAVASEALRLVDRLRANEARRADITGALLRNSRISLGVVPSTARAAEFRAKVRDCEAAVSAIPLP